MSSAIADIAYETDRERLTVTFVTGRIYEYFDVPSDVAAAFESAASRGTYFNQHIRDRYRFHEITASPD
jgi:lysyl-tRNA synthetase class 2